MLEYLISNMPNGEKTPYLMFAIGRMFMCECMDVSS